jgi:hypothetical protein
MCFIYVWWHCQQGDFDNHYYAPGDFYRWILQGSATASYPAFAPLTGGFETTFSADTGTLTVTDNHAVEWITGPSNPFSLLGWWYVAVWTDASADTRFSLKIRSAGRAQTNHGDAATDYRLQKSANWDLFDSPDNGDWVYNVNWETVFGQVGGETAIFGGETYHRVRAPGFDNFSNFSQFNWSTRDGGHLIWSMGGATTLIVVSIVNVYGHVNLQDFGGSAASVPLVIEFVNSHGVVVDSIVVYADSNGDFVIPAAVLPDTYDVTMKASHWLRQRLHNVTTTANGATGLQYDLINGDVDGDNEVAIGDYSLLSSAFNSVPGDANWIADADLNGDDGVDIGDYAILSTNFGEIGDE